MVTFVFRDGKLVEKVKVATVDAPQIITDEMAALRHMADGKMYTSKRRFRAATRAADCIEFGNEKVIGPKKPVVLDRRQRREDIRRALHDLRDGRAPTIRQILEMNKGD
jgi:hypothetical protein